MRRLAAVFSSKRDKSSPSDHQQSSNKHLRPLLTLSPPSLHASSSTVSTPQPSSSSDHPQSSSSSSGSTSLNLPTPEEDSQSTSLARKSTRRSWKIWLGGKHSEPDPPPLSGFPKPEGWDERPPTLQLPDPRTRHRVRKNSGNIADERPEDSDDDRSARSSISRPRLVASPERARHNLEILINNNINPPLFGTPFLQPSPDYLFPRSCNRLRPTPMFDMRHQMLKRQLLKRLQDLSAEDAKEILPFSLRNSPVPLPALNLPSHEVMHPPKSAQIFFASPGIRRWISRPCFEDRFSVFLPSRDGIRQTPVVGSLAVAALEYSELLDAMVDPDFDPSFPSESSQDTHRVPLLQDIFIEQSPPPETGADPTFYLPVHPRTSYLPSPSPLRNQRKSDVSLSDSMSQSTVFPPVSGVNTSMTLQLLPNAPSTSASTPVAAPVKRVVRFAEEDSEDKAPLHFVRQKKKQEEKANFLRAEQRKRLMEQEQEQHRQETEASAQEQRRLAKVKERKKEREVIEQRQYAELVASTRLRRENQRAGIIPGLKLDNNGGHLAPLPPATSLREWERNRPHEPQSSPLMPQHTSPSTPIPRRDASDLALSPSHLYTLETSYRSGGYSPGGSASSHNHQSRPGSMYSSSSEDGWLNNKHPPVMSTSFTRSFPDRTNPYPMRSSSNQSFNSNSLSQAPNFSTSEIMNNFVLLPPSAPFMKHKHERYSRASSPGRSTSLGSLRGASLNLSSDHIIHSQQIPGRRKDSVSLSPSTSFNSIDSGPTYMRSYSPDTRRASMPVPDTNRRSATRSQSAFISRGRIPTPHSQGVQDIQHPQSPNPWTALPTQRGYLPTVMPVSPHTHSAGLDPSIKTSVPRRSQREIGIKR